jgi:ribosomal protein S18 acetylase RimI-like enzyme
MSADIILYDEKFLPEMKEIFFESSTKKDFKDEAEKEAFFFKYLGYYLKQFPDLALVAVSDKVLGYVVSAPVSDGSDLFKIQPHLELFQSEFDSFPAHLHINCHHESRGLGIGSKLILEMEKMLKALKITGVHIMTGPLSENRSFYKKLGYTHSIEQNFHDSPILFMGKSLSEN